MNKKGTEENPYIENYDIPFNILKIGVWRKRKMCKIRVGDVVISTAEHKRNVRTSNFNGGTVIEINTKDIATVRESCGFDYSISVAWLEKVGTCDCHCHHHCNVPHRCHCHCHTHTHCHCH